MSGLLQSQNWGLVCRCRLSPDTSSICSRKGQGSAYDLSWSAVNDQGQNSLWVGPDLGLWQGLRFSVELGSGISV